jgi:IS30 family transposase
MPYVQLTREERYVIAHLRMFKLSLREIARRLNRHHSTVSRELKRNGPDYPDGVYWYDSAQAQALERKAIPRHQRRRTHRALYRHVAQRLQARWSPACIAGRLVVDYPRASAMRVSHETIYRWIFRDAQAGGQLYRCLCLSHKRRCKQRRYGSLRGLIPNRVSITERPAVVDRRSRFGDWEGDTVYGKRTRFCLLTQVERKSRYLIAAKIPDRRAHSVAACKIAQFSPLPRRWRRTLTLDNGKEFAGFKHVEQATGLRVFFADPCCAWQRGTNENTNGLLRQYFPKGTDFSQISNDELAFVVRALNNRPRKCLDYRTPSEIVHQALGGALGS